MAKSIADVKGLIRMYDQWTMDNGLRVVAEKLDHVRSVAIGVWIGVGSSREKEAENGLSHFIEHMVFKGTEKRSAKDIAEEMDAVGGQLNAFTSKDCTCYYAKVIDEDLPLAVDILSDLTRHAVLDKGELDKERGVILEEIAMVEDTPEDLVHELLSLAQFGDHALGMPILGPGEAIKAYSRDSLIDFMKSHYLPQRVVVSVAGNYEVSALRRLLDDAFGDWDAHGDFSIANETPEILSQRLFREKETEQMQLCLGYPGVALGNDDTYALAVLNNILGGGMSSRLFQRIREDMGMAYSIYSYPLAYTGCGLMNIYAGTSPDNAEVVLQEMQKEIAKLLRGGITEKEYAQSRQQLKGNYILGLESVSGRMQSLGRSQLLLSRVNTPADVIGKIEAVSKADVLRVAEALFSAKPSAAVVGPGAESILKAGML